MVKKIVVTERKIAQEKDVAMEMYREFEEKTTLIKEKISMLNQMLEK